MVYDCFVFRLVPCYRVLYLEIDLSLYDGIDAQASMEPSVSGMVLTLKVQDEDTVSQSLKED